MSKGLKRLLTAKKGDAGESISLEETIYRAVKVKPVRDINNILLASRKLTRVLRAVASGEIKDFDTVNNAYLEFTTQFLAEGERDMRKFHPSSLRHDCERQLFYFIGGTPYSDRVADGIDGRVQMIFDQGHWFHSYIQAVLHKAGILVQAEVPVVDKKRYIGGRMDGKVKWKGEIMALEIKTMNSFRFAKGKIAPFEDNVFQNSFYADHLGIDKILFLYFNKDTSEIAVHIKPTNKTFARLANEKIDHVLESIELDKPPRRTCKSKDSEKAVTCPFRTLCFK